MLYTSLTSSGISFSHVSPPFSPCSWIPNLAPSPYFRISAILMIAFLLYWMYIFRIRNSDCFLGAERVSEMNVWMLWKPGPQNACQNSCAFQLANLMILHFQLYIWIWSSWQFWLAYPTFPTNQQSDNLIIQQFWLADLSVSIQISLSDISDKSTIRQSNNLTVSESDNSDNSD